MFSGGSLWQPPPSIHHKEPERPPLKDINEPKRGELTDKSAERSSRAELVIACCIQGTRSIGKHAAKDHPREKSRR